GTTQLSGNLTPSGSQAFNDRVVLTAAAVTRSTGANAAIQFNNSVGGLQDLTVDTAGVTTFAADVSVGNLRVTGPSQIDTATVTTTFVQNYGGDVSVSASTVTFTSTAAAGAATDITFTGPVGQTQPLQDLAATGPTIHLNGGLVDTVGDQGYHGAVTPGAGDTLAHTSPAGNVKFDSTVKGSSNLTVDANYTT